MQAAHSSLQILPVSASLDHQRATMFNIPGEHLESRLALGVLLDLNGLFVLKEKKDGAQRGGFPGSSRLKQNSRRQGCVCRRHAES